jgi:DNA-binding transcriptional regulator YiaG
MLFVAQNPCTCHSKCYNIFKKVEVRNKFCTKLNQGGAMTIELETFSERVKKVRSQLNLSQEDLAHAIGVSFATVNRWENGKTLPSKLALNQFNSFCATQRNLELLND